MKTIANQIHAAKYQQVKEVVQSFNEQAYPRTKSLADAFLSQLSPVSVAPDEVQSQFFVDAIRHRLDQDRDPGAEAVGNLYLTPDQGQQIKMFNLMAEKFPLVRYSQAIVNTAYCRAIAGASRVVVLDIGIGTGQQIVRLLEQLATTGGAPPERVTVIGIEPAADSLTVAENALRDMATKYGIAFEFKAIAKATEALTSEDWRDIEDTARKEGDAFVVNASFALHHVRPASLRTELFRRFKAMNPARCAIIEPYADFLTPNIVERFDNAWHHYGLTFGAIDKIDASPEEKNMLKRTFFSREIQDVLSEDQQRTEQFETGEMWLSRMRSTGFEPCRNVQIPALESRTSDFSLVTASVEPAGYIALNVEGFPVISVIICE